MKILKKILHGFFSFLPHLNIALSICFVTFFCIDRVNRPMAFINNDITKGLLVVFSASVILQSIYTIFRNQK